MAADTGNHSAPARSAFRLGILAVSLAVVVAVIALATRERIAHNEAGQVMKVIATVLPRDLYDNEPDRDRVLVRAPELLGSAQELPIYRARLHGEPTAVVVTAVARQGFVGPIRLLVAVAVDGRVLAVRAIAQEETPGLGDRIDASKSDWIDRFGGRSIGDPVPERWRVRRDGGEFDELTGATVTSRAVVGAVRDAALYFEQHRNEIFGLPAQ